MPGHKEGALPARPDAVCAEHPSGVCVAVDVESLILEASENCALIAQKAWSRRDAPAAPTDGA
jgi:hypothetical protein